MCAVDQKRPFFPRAGPFLDLPPFKGPFPLTGALTGRQPYGQAPYGEASYGKAPLGDFLRETPLITGKLTGRLGPYGKPLTRRDGPYEKGRSLQGPLRADRLTGRPLTGGFLREGSLRITGKLTGSYGERLYQNWTGISACAP